MPTARKILRRLAFTALNVALAILMLAGGIIAAVVWASRAAAIGILEGLAMGLSLALAALDAAVDEWRQ
jgi:hypothetical protein